MARYNRAFLVPYLQSVCALELAANKLANRDNKLAGQIQQMQNGKYNPVPKRQEPEPEITCGRLISILLGVFFIGLALLMLMGILMYKERGMFWAVALLGSIGGFFLWGAISSIKESNERNASQENKYRKALENYENIRIENKNALRKIPQVQGEQQNCLAERRKVATTLQRVYSANIIPRQYRNIYAAVYLYDWFSTSQADDLDMALNMFVLEEIKAKLDRIIANQTEIILNQCIMTANQQRSYEQQKQHSEMMQRKLDQIQASNDERNNYLNMIACNTEATAYFAAASYLQRI